MSFSAELKEIINKINNLKHDIKTVDPEEVDGYVYDACMDVDHDLWYVIHDLEAIKEALKEVDL